MRPNQMLMVLGLACAAAGCGASAQTRAHTQIAGANCSGLADADRQVAELYAPGNVEQVEPLYREEFRARAIQYRYVAGAKLYVPASRGMNEAYLERLLSCHAASSSDVHPNDPLQHARVKNVDVSTAGQRFVIAIEGRDRADGHEILNRARALHGQSTSVEVRQLSSASAAPSQL